MLRTLNDIIGYELNATDGRIGHVHDFLFDDRAWSVRYLVADTGSWLPGRKVLLSPEAVSSADGERRRVKVELTCEQIEQSPELAADRPVSRQQEEKLVAYYGWSPYWRMEMNPMAGVPPMHVAAETPPPVEPPPEQRGEDPNLRSVREVTGYHVKANDGRIGHVEAFIGDIDSWSIRYLVVDTRDWLPGKKVLVAPDWCRDIDWDGRQVSLELTRQQVQDSPAYDPNMPVNREYEQRLYDFHGRRAYWRETEAAHGG